MEDLLLKVFSLEALLLCLAVASVTQVIKTLFSKYVQDGWGHKIITILPVFVGLGLAMLPGAFVGSVGLKILWGLSCGSISTMLFKMLKRFLKGKFNDGGKDEKGDP